MEQRRLKPCGCAIDEIACPLCDPRPAPAPEQEVEIANLNSQVATLDERLTELERKMETLARLVEMEEARKEEE